MDNISLQPDPRILDRFPYPVAYPYSLIFDANEKPSIRRWALCFTEYQALRLVGLPLVSQYLREPIDETVERSIKALNTAIAAIRSPFFSDWISLLFALRKHLPQVGIAPLFGGLDAALAALRQPEPRLVGLRGEYHLNPLEAILALRNGTAHGGLADEAEAAAHVREYLPVLHEVLRAFAFLGDCELWVCRGRPEAIQSGHARLRLLRGVTPGEPVLTELADDLSDALAEANAVLRVPGQPPQPLYPLLNPVNEQEPLYLYDGHYGIQVGVKQGVEERSYIYYLGTHHRAEDTPACGRLKDLLAARRIHFFLSKDKTAPWTIADSATDYSRRTLHELIGTKYFPPCYLPFESMERHVQRFLTLRADPKQWPSDTTRPRHVNGLVLVGLAGSGKTNLLAHQVEQLLAIPEELAERENCNLVLFLRGNGIALRPEGMSLFRDVAEKLGVAVTAAETRDKAKSSTTAGFSGFRELFDHLQGQWKNDRVDGRRLILVLDALNEAPFAETVTDEALELIAVAAGYPWCKVILSTRQEWLSIWMRKMDAGETSRLEELRPWLYVVEQPGEHMQQKGPPVLTLEPFGAEQAAEVYRRYQAHAGHPIDGKRIPACRGAWETLIEPTRELLTNPLYLHLFMEAFDGREAEPVKNPPVLFRWHVERALAEHPGLEASVEAIVTWLLRDLNRFSADLDDGDCNALRRAWAEGLTEIEARLLLSPVEGMAHEGFIVKRAGEDGGGYRFVFQTVAEYLLYRYFVATRPVGEDELAYWSRRAQPETTFPEYAGAFGFLLRDWAARNKLDLIGPLVEAASGWLGGVLTTFLVEQAYNGHTPGQCSGAAEAAARVLEENGAAASATALLVAASAIVSDVSYSVTAQRYLRASVAIGEPLWLVHPDQVMIGFSLAYAFFTLGWLLSKDNRIAEAEAAYRRSVDICEKLLAADPDHVKLGELAYVALSLLGQLLSKDNRIAEAEAAYRRSVDICEKLWTARPDQVEIGNCLVHFLIELGRLLSKDNRIAEAEAAYRRSADICEKLWAVHPDQVKSGSHVVRFLIELGRLLSKDNRIAEAETAYRHSVDICEKWWAAYPEQSDFGDDLADALYWLGQLLDRSGRTVELEAIYQRRVNVLETLWATHPDQSDFGDDLAYVLCWLGRLLSKDNRVAEAEAAYRRSVDIYERLWAAHPDRQVDDDIDIKIGLGVALGFLSHLLLSSGRRAEGMATSWRGMVFSFRGLLTEACKKLKNLLDVFGWPQRWLNAIKSKFRKT